MVDSSMSASVLSAEAAHDELTSYLKAARFNSKHMDHMQAVLYAGHFLELLNSILTLHRSQSHAGIPVLARGLFETCVRLACLAKDPRRAEKEFELEDLLQRKKFYQGASVDRADLSRVEVKIEELRKLGAHVRTTQKRLQDLGAVVNYSSYRFLSAFAHVQLVSLSVQAVRFEEIGHRVELFRAMEPDLESPLFDSVARMALETIQYTKAVLSAEA